MERACRPHAPLPMRLPCVSWCGEPYFEPPRDSPWTLVVDFSPGRSEGRGSGRRRPVDDLAVVHGVERVRDHAVLSGTALDAVPFAVRRVDRVGAGTCIERVGAGAAGDHV